MPNGSDGGKETSRKLPVSREKRSPFKVVAGVSGVGRGSALQRAHGGGSQELEERTEGGNGVAWAWAGWEQPLYQKQHPGRLARTCKGDNRAGTTGCLGALAGPGVAGGASAPPQRLQLVDHLLQLRLDGCQALQLLVLGENTTAPGRTGPARGRRSLPDGLCRWPAV